MLTCISIHAEKHSKSKFVQERYKKRKYFGHVNI